MSFKDDFKHEMRNVIKDVEKEINKTWKIDYKGHSIEITNQIKEEQLIIDGVTVDKKQRKSLLTHIIPYSKLSGILELQDGTKHKVSVKLGGYVRFRCMVKVDHETVLDESMKIDFLPWDHKEKIVPFIQQQIQSHHKIVADRLPDEDYLFDENEPRWAPGLSDYYVDERPAPFYVKKLLKLFEIQLNHPTNETRKKTYEKIISNNMASRNSELIERFQQTQWDESRVQQEALWLLEHAAHREVVKFAVMILGCTNCEKYKELLFTIGMHEEFTSYVVFALKNGTIQGNEHVWRLAKSVDGWGKISAVEQLEASTPEIKRWLLTMGCGNTIMNEYLAYTCALNGDLETALSEDEISKELYDGASLIIQALLEDEVSIYGIDEYSNASSVLCRFIHHAHKHCQTIEDFYPILKINEFLNDEQEIWEDRLNDSWTQDDYKAIQKAVQPFINDSRWPKLAIDSLQQDFSSKALKIALFYRLDVIEHLFALLEKDPTNSEIYFAVMDTNHHQHIRELCTFAETHLSLSNLSDDEVACLQYIVQDLYEHDGVGLPLIQAALRSNDGNLQYHALSVLKEWPPSYAQKAATRELIEHIAVKTKDKEDRKLAKYLLKK
ncbi:hypothetical protein UP15_19115 [Bacillus pumilus]|uniref:hypothetical protein n=1 Tax=Bacillus altitudinis TaxID=293387 RepID=UPI0007761A28|nr:hypothetical protein [Bacillus altitudinis]AMM90982.1 hypothetical protein UP15_19115 [Bacillus pumilus]MCI9884954.1 hypothetical protein [Bacillus altitudinis]MCM3061945.1 hypothetical protein [Bacillus altitudinis]MCM3074649.1 hypothetical protein [Bacillus altitudinis]